MVSSNLLDFAFTLGIGIGYFILLSLLLILWGCYEFDKNRKLMLMPISFRLDYQKFQLSRNEIIKYNAEQKRLSEISKVMGDFKK